MVGKDGEGIEVMRMDEEKENEESLMAGGGI